MFLARVYVTLKPTVNDPQGLTIRGGLHSLGFDSVESGRAGKYLEIRLDGKGRASAEAQGGGSRGAATAGRRALEWLGAKHAAFHDLERIGEYGPRPGRVSDHEPDPEAVSKGSSGHRVSEEPGRTDNENCTVHAFPPPLFF